jgi:hypothetical protein
MNNIRKLIKNSKKGDKQTVCLIKDMFNNMIVKYSFLFGAVDEDLYSEQVIAFMKCVKRFEINEELYIKLFQTYDLNFSSENSNE